MLKVEQGNQGSISPTAQSTKRKCAGCRFLAPAYILLRCSESPTKLLPPLPIQTTRKMSNFYAVHPVLYASKFNVNLLVKKLPVDVRKLRVQLFCAYVLGLYFTGARLLVQKLRVEH